MTQIDVWAELVRDYRNKEWERRNVFRDWESYCAAMYPPPEMTPAERADRVAQLREAGMPFKAIGVAVGMSSTQAFRVAQQKGASATNVRRSSTPARRALHLVMRKPALDLGRATRRLIEIKQDARFHRNREVIAREFGPQLRIAHDELSAFIAAMDEL